MLLTAFNFVLEGPEPKKKNCLRFLTDKITLELINSSLFFNLGLILYSISNSAFGSKSVFGSSGSSRTAVSSSAALLLNNSSSRLKSPSLRVLLIF